LSRESFDRLAFLLEPLWLDAQAAAVERRRKTPRVNAIGAGTVGLEFPSRLFLVLVFLRGGVTYRSLEAQYRVGKDTICRSVEVLCALIPGLGVTLRDGRVVLNEACLAGLLAEMAEPEDGEGPDGFGGAVIVDGSFTQVGRPAGWEQQKLLYNAHRGVHCLVFQTCVNEQGDLLWLSPQSSGSTHDLTALAESALGPLLRESGVPALLDKGYQGVRRRLELRDDHLVFLPTKKPRNGELSEAASLVNNAYASLRIKVEHAHSRLKNWAVLRRYRGGHAMFTNIIRTIGVLMTLHYRT
jgi:hypothetical protein